MIEQIKQAAELSNRCQRNWDHTATIPDEHVDALIHCIRHAPTKQNETHYKAFVVRDPQLIYSIYDKTNHFAIPPLDTADITQWTDNEGRTIDDYNVRNSQVNANLLIAFCDDWKQENSRTLIHKIVEEREQASPTTHKEKEKQRFISIGIAAGELILAANLLGYKTGLCSAFDAKDMKPFFDGALVRLLVGIGMPHPAKNRCEHEEVYNRDITAETQRNGAPDQKWLFPSFPKDVTIKELP